ncbi:MAG TPA: hypothetical protein EYP24_02420, partial [bacterium (Candidatus Stahlbacteria)]|nr:hypothetical protein [Candidatus Stahlbacteria bacterium]
MSRTNTLGVIVLTNLYLFLLSSIKSVPVVWYYYLLILSGYLVDIVIERVVRPKQIPFYGTLSLILYITIVNIIFFKTYWPPIPAAILILLTNYHLTFPV